MNVESAPASSAYDFSWVTERYFYDFPDPNCINTGWCYVWAWLAKLGCPEAQLITYEDTDDVCQHAFIRVGDLYFDSSRPLGTRVLTDLWFFQEFGYSEGGSVMEMDPEDFQHWWGIGRKFHDQGLIAWPWMLPERPTLEVEDEW